MIKERNPVILFPYDFTEVSDVATKHAIALAKLFGYSLKILNILDRGTRSFMKNNSLNRQGLEARLEEMSRQIKEKEGIEVDYIVKPASIKQMCKLAEASGVTFMVLGIDKPAGSKTPILQVVRKSPSPVFVIQQGCEKYDYRNIMFPLDDFHASRQKVGWAALLAHTVHGKVHIFTVQYTEKDNQFKYNKIVEQVEDFFFKRNIRFTTAISKDGMKSFTNEVLEYCHEHQCDSMVIMHRPGTFWGGIHPIDKALIFNDSRIPVMCVNLSEFLITGGIA